MNLSPEERKRIYEEEQARVEAEKQANRSKNSYGALFTLLTLILIALIVVIGIVLSKSQGGGKTAEVESNARSSLVPRSQSIVDGEISVAPSEFQTFRIVVNTATMQQVHVDGQFVARGGGGNDIIALLMDDVSYTNWSNGHEARVFYSSKKVTTDRFTVSITESGTYYLVFSNRFSTSSTKRVNASVTLAFSEIQQ